MRQLLLAVLFSMLFLGLANAQAISINTDGSNPDTSAILDVKSTTKGVLVPRLDSFQRVSIAYPAAGLLVYEIGSGATANAFWFNAGTPGAPNWQRIPGLRTPGNCSPLTNTVPFQDCDEDTRIHVEKTYDEDIIRMDLGDNIANNINPNPAQVLVLRRNNPGKNTMLEIFDVTGRQNTFVGEKAGNANTPGAPPFGSYNTALGYNSLSANITGHSNTAIGVNALRFNTGGYEYGNRVIRAVFKYQRHGQHG